ncbi:MAG: hypothetical protein WKF47_12580 [Geodermatophilaceae bacterium]
MPELLEQLSWADPAERLAWPIVQFDGHRPVLPAARIKVAAQLPADRAGDHARPRPEDDQWLARATAMLEADLTREFPLPDHRRAAVFLLRRVPQALRQLSGLSPCTGASPRKFRSSLPTTGSRH